MSQIYINAEHVSLDYQLGKPSLFRLLTKQETQLQSVFRAINEVSFSISEGDRVAVIGRNGAGKSTLLKLIAGVLTPTQGQIHTDGEVFPLLNLSADILAKATCLQNIKLRGLYMGLKGDELDEYIESVRAEADIEPFLYSPVSSLSTGMKTRFLVSLIGGIQPDVLVMDEWIGTADQSYTEKKESKLSKLVAGSKSFVLATHNRALVNQYCDKVILMEQGNLEFIGATKEGFEHFNQLLSQKIHA